MPSQRVGAIQALYDESRFLDAWARVRADWFEAPLDSLDRDELLMAARLARRLGSTARGRLALRRLRVLAPDDAEVAYYLRAHVRPRTSPFEDLRDFDAVQAELPPRLHAFHLGTHALRLATVRDFEAARTAIEAARALDAHEDWLTVCAAGIAAISMDWSRALELAERAWAASPGMPYCAYVMGDALSALGRGAEGAARLVRAARQRPQSYEVLELGLMHALATLERGAELPPDVLPDGLYAATLELDRLAPLADRGARRYFARLRCGAARLEDRREALRRHAREAGTPFYARLAENLEAPSTGPRRILPHTPIRQTHLTCLPASLVCCASALGVDLDHDALVREMTTDGTPSWKVVRWARANGWTARPFIVDPESSAALIDAGLPFVVTVGGLAGSHAVAAIGRDPDLGTLVLHDPGSPAPSEMLLDHIGGGYAPLGPKGLVVVPPSHAETLAAIPLPGEAFALADIEQSQAYDVGDRAMATDAATRVSDDGVHARFLDAVSRDAAGRSREALDICHDLLRAHPDCRRLQSLTLRLARRIGDAAHYRELLRAIIHRDPLPGVDGSQHWIRVHIPILTEGVWRAFSTVE